MPKKGKRIQSLFDRRLSMIEPSAKKNKDRSKKAPHPRAKVEQTRSENEKDTWFKEISQILGDSLSMYLHLFTDLQASKVITVDGIIQAPYTAGID